MVGFMQYGGEYIKRMSLLFIFKVVNLFRETFPQLNWRTREVELYSSTFDQAGFSSLDRIVTENI